MAATMILNPDRFSSKLARVGEKGTLLERYSYEGPKACYDIVMLGLASYFMMNGQPCSPQKMHRQIAKHYWGGK